jgi:hypothetical protein
MIRLDVSNLLLRLSLVYANRRYSIRGTAAMAMNTSKLLDSTSELIKSLIHQSIRLTVPLCGNMPELYFPPTIITACHVVQFLMQHFQVFEVRNLLAVGAGVPLLRHAPAI